MRRPGLRGFRSITHLKTLIRSVFGVLIMTRLWLVFALLWIGSGPVSAQSLAIQTLDGGGAVSQFGSMFLNSAIDGYGLPNGYADRSLAGTTVLTIGYYPSLISIIIRNNGADPIWLEVVRLVERRPAARETKIAKRTENPENP